MILLSREQQGCCSFPSTWRHLVMLGTVSVCLCASQNSIALEVDTRSREASRQFYLEHFQTNSIDMDWSGAHRSCDAGATAADFQDSVEQQINFFRAMAGVPAEVRLDDDFNAKAQEAAMVMSKNFRISHFPPEGWGCYTEDAAEAARSSNLLLGTVGPNAVTRYMYDPGPENYFVGHRRWILHPQTERMGTGDVPRDGFLPAANTLWVFDGNTWNPRPETRDPYIAWPPAGFVPSQVVYPRWSFGMPDADFSSATVSATLNGSRLPLRIEPVLDGYSDPTLVWVFDENLGGYGSLADDMEVSISIGNVVVDGVRRGFNYDVTIFDPNVTSIPEPVITVAPARPTVDVTPARPVCPGSDFNEDGVLSFDDFLLLARSFGSVEPADGDTNCDGSVDFDDFLLFVDDYQAENPEGAAQVPEPNSWVLGLLASLGFFGFRRRPKKN